MLSKSRDGLTDLSSPVLGNLDRDTPIPSVCSFNGIFVWKQVNSSKSNCLGSRTTTKEFKSLSLVLNGGYGSIGPRCLQEEQLKAFASSTAILNLSRTSSSSSVSAFLLLDFLDCFGTSNRKLYSWIKTD